MSKKKVRYTGNVLAMIVSIIAVLANISEIIQMFQKNKSEKFENSVVDTFSKETITEQSTVEANNTYSENSYTPYYSEERYDYNINVTINDKRKYTIVEESSNCNNLKSNTGWTNLNDAKNSNSSSGGQSNNFEPYIIKIENSYLPYYSGAGYGYTVNGAITDQGKYTIVEEEGDWGKLKSGAGWINLNDAKNFNSSSGGQSNSFEPYIIKIESSYLPYYSGAGYGYTVNGAITDKGKYTIVEEEGDWGKLKSGAGWINLNDAKTPYTDGLADNGIGSEKLEDIQSNSVEVYSCNITGQINAPNGSINGYATSYIVDGGAMSCVRTDLMNEWHVTAVNYCTNGTIWYELYDTDDGDYYGWVESGYINFY